MTESTLRAKINQKVVDLERELEGFERDMARPDYDGIYYVPKPAVARLIESRRDKLTAQIAILKEVVAPKGI